MILERCPELSRRLAEIADRVAHGAMPFVANAHDLTALELLDESAKPAANRLVSL